MGNGTPIVNSNSLSFDGQDDETVLGNSLNLSNQITIQTWINFDIGGTNDPRIISNDYNNCNGFEVITIGTGSQRQILFHYNCSAGASGWVVGNININSNTCLLYTSPSPRDATLSRMPSSA